MSQKRNDHYLLGLGLLTAVSTLCLKGLGKVEKKLQTRQEKEKQKNEQK